MLSFPLLVTNRTAGAAIAAYRLVTRGASELLDVQADAATDALIGVNGPLAIALGARYDCVVAGIAPVEYGDAVVRGDPLTSDALGRAIPATGTNDRVFGVAWEDGAVDEIGSLLIAPGVRQASTGTLAASAVTVADSGNKFTGTNVETVLAELEARVAALE